MTSPHWKLQVLFMLVHRFVGCEATVAVSVYYAIINKFLYNGCVLSQSWLINFRSLPQTELVSWDALVRSSQMIRIQWHELICFSPSFRFYIVYFFGHLFTSPFYRLAVVIALHRITSSAVLSVRRRNK